MLNNIERLVCKSYCATTTTSNKTFYNLICNVAFNKFIQKKCCKYTNGYQRDQEAEDIFEWTTTRENDVEIYSP